MSVWRVQLVSKTEFKNSYLFVNLNRKGEKKICSQIFIYLISYSPCRSLVALEYKYYSFWRFIQLISMGINTLINNKITNSTKQNCALFVSQSLVES